MASHADPFNLRATHQLSAKLARAGLLPSTVQKLGPVTWYDVKFYPHNGRASSQVFAVAGASLLAICRCTVETIEILRLFKDESIKDGNEAKAFNCVEWSRASNGDPLVCVAGRDYRIKVLNVRTGELVNTLIGHADVVADLAISPDNSSYLASASYDHTIRLWSLDPKHKATPTAALLLGGGHDRQVLTVGWHRNGKYLLSGGMDTRLNLWKIPNPLEETLGTDWATRIYYPHFSSTEVHHDYIDCVHFHGDLILSRSAKDNKIILSRIDGFDSSKDPPAAAPAPPGQTVQSDKNVYLIATQTPRTRSAWGGKFQRLFEFVHPHATNLYVRIGLFEGPGVHPVLAAGNEKGKVSFWDLQKLEDAGIGQDIPTVEKDKTEKSEAGAEKGKTVPKTVPPKGNLTTGVGDPVKSIVPHKAVQLQDPQVTVRQVAFSPDGRWCVAVGNNDMVAVFSRWEAGFPE